MPKPEDLVADDLPEGRRLAFAPNSVGVCHSHFGLIAGYVAFVVRSGDMLIAELADGRQFEVNQRAEVGAGYSLCRFAE